MNYDQLKLDIADWLMRADLEPQIPTFIRLAEAQLNRVIWTRETVSRAQAQTENQFMPLPPDWRKSKNIQRTDGQVLQYMTLEEMDLYRQEVAKQPAGQPEGPMYFSYAGENLELAPEPTPENPASIEMIYYRRIPNLDPENRPTNWLLEKHYDVYLYGALVHSAPFLQDDQRVALWTGLRDAALTELNMADTLGRESGSTLTRRQVHNLG